MRTAVAKQEAPGALPAGGERKYRVLVLATHPVQYASPTFRRLAVHPQVELTVAYCMLQGAEAGWDSEFGAEVQWDVPLLDGYRWVHVRNRSLRPGLGRFFGLFNPGLWRLVRGGEFDVVVSYLGYSYANFWIAWAAARASGTAFLFGTDAQELRPRDGRAWKTLVKRWAWPRLFGLADVVLAPSSGTVALIRSLGIPEAHIALTPYVVDNDWWRDRSKQADRAAVRASWGIPAEAPVVLFCAKLQPWKRPHDLLRAFAAAGVPEAYLVFAGEGPLRAALESEAQRLGLSARVRFLGFVNQSSLPGVYGASDLLVLPSDYEPFGVVVNEAMLCSCPVAVSDRVGARFDLVRPGETGAVFPFGDLVALATMIQHLLRDQERLKEMGVAGRKRMESWSPRENVESLLRAIDVAEARKCGMGHGKPSHRARRGIR